MREPTQPMRTEAASAGFYHSPYFNRDYPRLQMRGRKQDRSARVVVAGHALVQNLRRGHDELAVGAPAKRRVAVAFDDLAVAI